MAVWKFFHGWDLKQLQTETATQNYSTETVAATQLATTQITADAEERMNAENADVKREEIEANRYQAELASADNRLALEAELEKARIEQETELTRIKDVDSVTAQATLTKAKSLCLDKLRDFFKDMTKWDEKIGTVEGYYGQKSQKTNLSDFILQFTEKFGTAFEDLTDGLNG